MKRIAALLTVHNRKDKTQACLRNLFDQIMPDDTELDVYLTDDGCTDGTRELVMEQFPQVQIVEGDGNLFWNRGMIAAWKEAAKCNYDYYLWLNDDTYIYQNVLKRLVSSSLAHGNSAIIVGSTVDTATHSKQTYGGRIKKDIIPPCEGCDTRIDYFNGNIVLVPCAVYNKLGLLDSFFSHSKGDFDYGMRAKQCGIEMYQIGVVGGECDVHESISKWCNSSVPLKQRWQALYRPNGMPPKESFHLNHRHYGLVSAIRVYCTIHLRCFFPRLWLKKNERK